MSVEQKVDLLIGRFDALERKIDAMDRKFSVQFDAVRADIRLVAEGVDATNQRLDRNAVEARRHHDAQYSVLSDVLRHVRTRVERLEER